MKLISIDYAAKTGWAYGEIIDGSFNIIEYGKFSVKGKTEKEKTVKLFEKTMKLLREYSDSDIVLFEDPFVGGVQSAKTLRATFGKRYSLIICIALILPNAEIYTIKPMSWWKHIPLEFKYSKKEEKKIAKGKEKKELSINYANQNYPTLGLKWLNERVDCDNDVADAINMAFLYAKGLLDKNKERIG